MCGIAGALDLTGLREFPQEHLLAMTNALAHRGPDDEHLHFEPGLAMGARRLSIVDLEGGRQPIANESGEIWVAFNGELFDYPEIRKDLLARGHRLATRCDTEAWVHLYEDFGEEIFSKTRGQFAVSLWDRTRRTVILGRDRVGICPLYYTEADGWLLWASEIKALLASAMVTPRPDPKAINFFFTFFCAPTHRTFFEEIHLLPPGYYLRAREGSLSLHPYWDLEFPPEGQERRVEDPRVLTEEFESLIRAAIKRRLHGDVPVVSYLSGGLDSSVILTFSSQEHQRSLPAFTISLNGAGHDEGRKAAESAAILGSPLQTVKLSPGEIAQTYPSLLTAAEGPVMDAACACLLRLAATVHQAGYKVALTGEGADEALAGYFWFKTQKFRMEMARLWTPKPLHLMFRGMMGAIGGGRSHAPPLKALSGARVAQQDTYDFIAQGRETFFSQEMWQRLEGHSPYDEIKITASQFNQWHPLNQSLYAGYKIMLPGLLMTAKGDRVAMHSSVETRYPFLDEAVIDFCAQLPPSYKLHGWKDKWLLRQVALRSLPSPISRRPKTMFRTVMSSLFLGKDQPAWAKQLLSEESLKATGYFNPKAVHHAMQAQEYFQWNYPRRICFDLALMNVVAVQLWHHLFCGGKLTDLPLWSAKRIE